MATARTTYPEHEARHPWLVRLLNAYHISDEAARAEIAQEEARRGEAVACREGCRTCCQGQVIPLSDFEALGLWWFAAEVMPPEVQARLRPRLLAGRADEECVFLLDGGCAVYPLRPFVCRQYFVFGRACAPGENVYETRPRDVFKAALGSGRDMAWELLPLYGKGEEDIDRLFESGYVSRKGKHLSTLPLENIVIHMDAAIARKSARNITASKGRNA